MSHDGRMIRGKEKLSKGIKDIETEYYLLNSKPVEKEVIKEIKPIKKEKKKDAKSNKWNS